MISYLESAFKHGIDTHQIETVLRSGFTEAFDEGLDDSGHFCVMFVGFDADGRLLEVKVKFVHCTPEDDDQAQVFHADKATLNYRRLFRQRKGK